ncbi:MAG: VacJ family lipoprotein [Gammaproteobacteria bacterium]|nr:VacJ family lipoprotein [Gammaproteobacteria bacterium]
MRLSSKSIFHRVGLLLAVMMLLSACAGTARKATDERDPWESMNRSIYHFNDRFDYYVFNPVARGYQAVTPRWLDDGVTNFFNNLGDVPNSLNNLLQGKSLAAVSDIGRICINSTIGLLGFIDVATPMGLERHKEDFGQTMAVWGIAEGPYLVLPILGPSSVRGSAGWVGDFMTEPYYYVKDGNTYYGYMLIDAIDIRADLLGASRILEQASFDPYSFHRETYFQRRRNLIHDGNPPPDQSRDEELELLDDLDIKLPTK